MNLERGTIVKIDGLYGEVDSDKNGIIVVKVGNNLIVRKKRDVSLRVISKPEKVKRTSRMFA